MSKHNDPPTPALPFGHAIKSATLVDIARRLAHNLRKSGRPYCLLTGIERGPAGIPEAYHPVDGYNDGVAASFSFCVDGQTYTAFEDPDDGYRSALGDIAARPGNHCHIQFEPCACIPSLSHFASRPDGLGYEEIPFADIATVDEQFPDLFSLVHPLTGETVLSVGTDRSEDYFPSFVGHHDPVALTSAQACGLALADMLRDTLAPGTTINNAPRL